MNRTCQLIKQLRIDSGLTATQFSKVMGVSKSSISKWEDYEIPGIESLYRIARYFRVTVDELLNGSLNTDSNTDLLIANYDLSDFDIPKLIEEKNEERLINYYQKCGRIINTFLTLLPRAAYFGLSDEDLTEYQYISKYISVDNSVIQYGYDFESAINHKLNPFEMKAVKAFCESIKEYSKAEKDWEIRKIIHFRPNLYIREIASSKLVAPFIEMYKLLTQLDKDVILANTFNDGNTFDAFGNTFVYKMICSGGKLHKPKYAKSTIWDDDIIRDFKGTIIPLAYDLKDEIHKPIKPYEELRYSEYLELVDENSTSLVKEACQLRHSNPYEYYTRLKSGKYDHILDLY